ncbi:hypothetical protein OPT61_g2551 [Boeremia exigua]|uniref:Uncharacterized protein n=1 Tax=Boeremia exigua TaxID=749465 RepID=A0ACC2ILA3_9PLEO|nr:hypothetical protein OPT61_g2551 [Boeremia exigua]
MPIASAGQPRPTLAVMSVKPRPDKATSAPALCYTRNSSVNVEDPTSKSSSYVSHLQWLNHGASPQWKRPAIRVRQAHPFIALKKGTHVSRQEPRLDGPPRRRVDQELAHAGERG